VPAITRPAPQSGGLLYAPLLPPTQRRSIPVEAHQVEAVMAAEDDAASDLLQLLYAFLNSDAFP
jgi:hypothetical protein